MLPQLIVGKLYRGIIDVVKASSRHRQRAPQKQWKRRAALNEGRISGPCHVIDGDTIVIGGLKVRLSGIDAPELHHPWGRKAKAALAALCKRRKITAHTHSKTSYDRIVARCYLPDGTDLSAAMVINGLALDWSAYSRGRYRHLEPEGVRNKLALVTHRQNKSQ